MLYLQITVAEKNSGRGKEDYYMRKGILKAVVSCVTAALLMAGCGGSGAAEEPGSLQNEAAGNLTEPEHRAAGRRQPEGEPIRIGAIYALSGNNAAIGTNILRGIDFAAEDINGAGGVSGRPVEIIRGDTEGDPAIARAEAERLIVQDPLPYLPG